MHLQTTLLSAALLAPLAAAAGLYPKSSAVLNVDAKNYADIIKKSDKVSILEFYAPWCGHCQNLKPAYEKAAKSLAGLANVAAINCDDDDNKPFCGQMGIKGFPTLKTVKFGKSGKPMIQDYQGPRTAAGIVEAVSSLISNTVERITDDKLESFLEENNSTAKALIFSNKGTVSTLVKVISIEFGENMIFAQVRDKEQAANEMFGIESYPTVVVLPGGERSPVTYSGKIEKQKLSMFLSSYADTWSYDNQDTKSKTKTKKSKKEKKASESSDSSSFAEASASHASSEAAEAEETPGIKVEVVDEDETFESPKPIVDEDAPTPVPVPDAIPPVEQLETHKQVQKHCLGPKTQTCVLAFLPDSETEGGVEALASLSKLAKKHKDRGDHLFPFYAVPQSNPGHSALKDSLGFGGDQTELYAVNGKRSWYKHHNSEKGFGIQAVEDWVDGIRFGEGKKEKLPEGLVVEVPTTEEVPVAEDTPTAEDEPIVIEEVVEEETPFHNEL